MKNIQAQYQDLLEGKMSKANFMRNVRMQFPQHVSPVTSYDDSIKILKGKRILNEATKPIGVYGHNPNAEMDEYRGIDHLNYYQVYHGIQYELAKMPEITDENYVKARKKVVANIMKNPDAYKELQLANFKAVKDMDKDLEMKEVKKDNLVDKPNEMKVVKKDVGGNTQATQQKKEAKKAKNGKGVQYMTQTPKGNLEAFATPGKEKTLKEGLKGKFDSDDNIYTYDHLINTDSPNKEQLAKVKAAIEADKEELKKRGKKAKYVKGDTVPYLELIKESVEEALPGMASGMLGDKVKALKEHILDELTTPNLEHEYINVGSRVKKKGVKNYDAAQVGNVTEFDGDTATVKWDNDSVEHVQVNVLTKREIPAPPREDNPLAKMPNLGGAGQSWLGKQIKEDPIGQQAAGNPEEEAELRANKIVKLKKKLTKAVKELLYRDQKTQRVQSFKPDDPITRDPEFSKVFKRV